MLEVTKQNGALPVEFYKRYRRIFPQNIKSYNINNLKTVGFIDPFEKEEKANNAKGKLPDKSKPTNNVYPMKRYIKDWSPLCLYIPSKDILFKLMRACVGAEQETDLWFWNDAVDRVFSK